MGYYSDLDIQIQELIEDGATRQQIADAYPMLREDELDVYFSDDGDDDGDYDDSMDGDEASALASVGWGTDEDYGCFNEEF